MRVFIIKSLIFLIIVLSITTIISLRYKPYIDMRSDCMAAIIDKHERLKEAGDNRLIFVGGSNLVFGINCEEIQKELKLNVVNLGLSAGLGIKFMLNEAISVVKKGDIMILCFEYPIYDSKSYDIDLIKHTQIIYPQSKSFYKFSLKDDAFLIYLNFKKTFDTKNIYEQPLYKRYSYNKFGDIVFNTSVKNPEKIQGRGKYTRLECIDNLEEFKILSNKCKSVGAKLYITFPSYPKSEFELNKSTINDLELLIKKELYFIPVISNPETFVFDDSLFFDTVYHLNINGRVERTKILIDILKKTLL